MQNLNEQESPSNIPIMVSLLGEYFFRQTWFTLCAETWKLAQINQPVYILSDGSLTLDSKAKLADMGLIVLPDKDVNEVVNSTLGKYPGISKLRQQSNLFKKLIDTSLFFPSNRILYCDSDVIFRRRFILPTEVPSFLFCIDDIPGYSGSWQIPIIYPIVTGLNSGFIYFDPGIVDLDYINYISTKYLLKSNHIWWLEQTCWALLAAKIENKGIFEGSDACVISGFKKRTPEEIKFNKTKYFTLNKKVSDIATIESMIGDASVVHFAGPGKPWIEPIYKKSFYDDVRELRWKKVENANMKDKLLLGIRMFIKG
ncbi:hypothetical protein [Anabaena sp. 4-3]|uniref:hypothetical protein n=1 Tax=Anabaena sp. 4-3 TaxID=1811979 RepID=UPI0008341372|nr:hypothetical protein [Anabaena sp. 4-3]